MKSDAQIVADLELQVVFDSFCVNKKLRLLLLAFSNMNPLIVKLIEDGADINQMLELGSESHKIWAENYLKAKELKEKLESDFENKITATKTKTKI